MPVRSHPFNDVLHTNTFGTRRHGSIFAILIVVFAGLLSAHTSIARQMNYSAGDPALIRQPVADTLHALIVFAKFLDDDHPGDPNVFSRGWPLSSDSNALPAFSSALISESTSHPRSDSSLTAYFYQQSLGQFVLTGEVYDSVLVSDHPESNYHRPQGGYGFLTKELLDRIDRYGFDYSRFDRNADGFLDYLFIILRRDSKRDAKRFSWTGISCLNADCGGGLAAGGPREQLTYDGLQIDWQRSGSYVIHRTPGNILPHYYLVRMMAHELGHDLWAPFFTHIPAIRNNDVPIKSNRSSGTNSIGYVLMAGAGGGRDTRGDETISAYERDLLGWIECDYLTVSKQEVVLRDLYTSSECSKLVLGSEQSGSVLYLTYRQPIGPFDRSRLGGRQNQFDMGLLRTSGLLVLYAKGRALDVIPADNTLDLSATSSPYQGDLFGPSTSKQLTPWTRPNINGYTIYPKGFSPSWQAVENIRYTNSADNAITFDYVADFRNRPIFREDSWIGQETVDYVFAGPVLVTNNSTLHISTILSFTQQLRIESGSTVVVAEGANVSLSSTSLLKMGANARLVIHGSLHIEGLVQRSPLSIILKGDSATFTRSVTN